MQIDVTHGGAFVAGLISFVSPCVLPLVPPYLCYMAGVSLDQLTGDAPSEVARRTVFLSALAFVLGFSTVFVLLGATASAIGQSSASHLDILGDRRRRHHHRHGPAFPRRVPDRSPPPAGADRGPQPPGRAARLLSRGARLRRSAGRRASGRCWRRSSASPAREQTVARGAVLLAVYSLGLGIPFIARRPLCRAVHALHAALPRPCRQGREDDGRAPRGDRRPVHHRPDHHVLLLAAQRFSRRWRRLG